MSVSTVEAVQGVLLASEPVIAVVGDRIYPMRMQQNVKFPAVVLGEVSDVPANTLDGTSETTTTRLQVDVYAKTYREAASVAALIDAELVKLKGPKMTVWREVSRDLYDDELNLQRRSTDFSVWRQP